MQNYLKQVEKLPVLLSYNEITNIMKAIGHPKHSLLISLAYGPGLRLGKIRNLKVGDVDSKGLTIHIKKAEGRGERTAIFPEKLKRDIQSPNGAQREK